MSDPLEDQATRDLTDGSKLSVRSAPEIHEIVEGLKARYRTSRDFLWRGKSLKEGIVNAAIAYVYSLPPGERAAALNRGADVLEAMLASGTTDVPAAAAGADGRALPTRPGAPARRKRTS